MWREKSGFKYSLTERKDNVMANRRRIMPEVTDGQLQVVDDMGDKKSILDVISPFLDPTNTLVVKVVEDHAIVNSTQVSADRLQELINAMSSTGYKLTIQFGHPDNFKDA